MQVRMPDASVRSPSLAAVALLWLVLCGTTASIEDGQARSLAECPPCPACNCQCVCKVSLEQACNAPVPSPQPFPPTPAPYSPSLPTPYSPLPESPSPPPQSPAQQQSPAPPPNEWQLLWSDEFDSWNSCNFEVQTGTGCQMNLCGWGNGQAQYYTARQPENIQVAGGHVHLQAQKETWEEWLNYARYTSGRLRTYKRHAFVPGDKWPRLKIEARMKVPKGQGLVTSFWMLPDESPPTCQGCGRYPGGWSTNGQINIATITSDATQVTGTLFYGGAYPDSASFSGSGMLPDSDSLADDFHTYTLEWNLTSMRWLLDGTQYHFAESGQGGLKGWWTVAENRTSVNAPFDQPFYIILNLALKGEKPFPQEDPTLEVALEEPKQLKIDYLRVYGFPGNGADYYGAGSPPPFGSLSPEPGEGSPHPLLPSPKPGVGFDGGHITGPSCCVPQ